MNVFPSDTKTFEYRPAHGHGLFLLIGSAWFALAFAVWAWKGGNGFRVLGTNLHTYDIHPYILWSLAGFFALGIPIGTKTVLQSNAEPRMVTLSSHAITAPRSQLSNRMEKIQYLDVKQVEVADVEGNILLEIRSQHKRLTIPEVCIADPETFDQLVADLEDRVVSMGGTL